MRCGVASYNKSCFYDKSTSAVANEEDGPSATLKKHGVISSIWVSKVEYHTVCCLS